MNQELPDVQAGLRKRRGTRYQIANIGWIFEKAREFQKNIYFCFIDYVKAFDCVGHNKLWKIFRDGNTRPLYLPPEKSVCRSRSNKLELDMERRIGSKLGKWYVKAICCHPAYLTYMQSTSCEMLGWVKLKLESSCVPFSFCLQSFPASGSFPMNQFFASGVQRIGDSASASVDCSKTEIQDWFPLGLTGWISFAVQGTVNSLLQHHSSKASILQCLALFSNSHIHISLLEKP